MKDDRKKKAALRIGCAALAVVLLAALLPQLGTHASAAVTTSLGHIEEIKADSKPFTILEITPQAGSGGIGYYIAGQEPTANWLAETLKQSGKTARVTYAKNIFTSLQARGLMGTTGTTDCPLTLKEVYSECYPWENTTGYTQATLSTPDKVTLANSTFAAASGGAYRLNSTAVFKGQKLGSYVQNIAYFVYGQPTAGTGYYYPVTTGNFTDPLDFTAAGIDDKIRELATEKTAMYTPVYKTDVNGTETEEIDHFVYAGTLGVADFMLNTALKYYYIDSTELNKISQKAVTSYDETYTYYAVADQNNPYKNVGAGSGCFDMDESKFEYVGDGSGDYNMTSASTGTSHEVTCSRIYYKGGYANNNWFLRYVLDVADDKVSYYSGKLIVYSVVASSDENITNYIGSAGLVVVSAGFDRSTGKAMTDKYAAGSIDLSAAQVTAIGTAIADKHAVVIDGALKGAEASTNVNELANDKLGNKTAGFVSGGLYGFFADTARTALATKEFTTPFDAALSAQNTNPYSAVRAELEYENFLRTTKDSATKDLFSTEVSMASCLRYIINCVGQRVVDEKTQISVLDVEPLTQTSSSGLSKDKVASWLPADCAIKNAKNGYPNNIKIDTMSTAEFISKIDDIKENYDLVYIGASNNNIPNPYKDGSMSGLRYSNIGDTRDVSSKLVGMLDSDYDSSGSPYKNTTQSYRLSGNDINSAKQTELVNFASAGLPIVISSDLVSDGHSAASASTMSVKLTGTVDSSRKLNLTATVTLSAALKGKFIFTLYLDGTAVNSTVPKTVDNTSAAVTSAAASWVYNAPGVYTCHVSFVGASQSDKDAVSNSVTAASALSADDYGSADACRVYPVLIDGTYNRGENTDTYTAYPASYLSSQNYQWQKNTYRYYYGQYISGGWVNYSDPGYNTSSITVEDNMTDHYRCIVNNNVYSYEIWYTEYLDYSSATQSKLSAIASISTDRTKLTVTPSTAPSLGGATYSYQWQYSYNYDWYDITGATTSTLASITSGTYYRCKVWLTGTRQSKYYAQSNVLYVTSSISATNNTDAGVTATIPAADAVKYTINQDRVDCNSILYKTLDSIKNRANVMTDSTDTAKAYSMDNQALLKYLNLSKPSITFSAEPAEYTKASQLGSSLVQDNTLSYTFTISNPTDPTPLTTSYTCKLYIDMNADGRYSDKEEGNEEISDLLVTDKDGGEADIEKLAAGTQYTVRRMLPSNYSGIIPWCLKIVQNGSSGNVHTSGTGYTYIKPQRATTIKVLQISSISGVGSGNYTLSLDNSSVNYAAVNTNSQNNTAREKYLTLFKTLKDAGVYDIQVETISITGLNTYSTADAIKAKFADKDMIILGFGDGYGVKESESGLGFNAAAAVVDFIGKGKAVLFTHDTTSFDNLPKNNSKYSDNGTYRIADYGGGSWYWGYYFNSVIRDAVGLDRYGVTSPYYGISKYSTELSSLRKAKSYENTNTSYNDYVSSSYGTSGIDFTTAAKELAKDGYSVAYTPKSLDSSAAQTQGYTNIQVLRPGDQLRSYAVSQLNKGQITTFPYNINTAAFGGTGTTLPVGETHQQYYQLNMSSDDVVVWYCLSSATVGNNTGDADYDKLYKNDGVNAYYIYNKGNVTYSGAGHNPGATTEAEAELFVNTMIAAYRAAATKPDIHFRTSDDSQNQTSLFMPVDGTDSASTTAAGGVRLYFKINDANLVGSKNMKVDFFYADASGNTDSDLAAADTAGNVEAAPTVKSLGTLDIHKASGGAAITQTGVGGKLLHSDTLYYVDLSDTILNTFAQLNQSNIKIYGKVTTTIGDGAEAKNYVGSTSMTLQKMGFMSLR